MENAVLHFDLGFPVEDVKLLPGEGLVAACGGTVRYLFLRSPLIGCACI